MKPILPLLTGLTLLSLLPASAAEFTRVLEQSFPVSPGAHLDLNSRYGAIVVQPGREDTLAVTLRLKVNSDTEEEANRLFDAVVSTLAASPLGVAGEIDFKGEQVGTFWRFRQGPEMAIEVSLPREFQLKLKTTSGPIQVTGISGQADLRSTSGDLRFLASPGLGRLETTSGSILVEGGEQELTIQSVSGDLTLKNRTGPHRLITTSGEIRVEQGSGDLTVQSTSGDVNILSFAGNHQVKTVSGSITSTMLQPIARGLDLQTVSGNISLRQSRTLGVAYDLQRTSGDLSDQLGLTYPEGPKKRKLRATYGDGAINVMIRTVSGDVILAPAPEVIALEK